MQMRGIALPCRYRATGEERTGQALLPPPSASEQAPQTETVFGDDSTLFSLTKKYCFMIADSERMSTHFSIVYMGKWWYTGKVIICFWRHSRDRS
jgi:hypothetical protein